jgi:hypothetical protein
MKQLEYTHMPIGKDVICIAGYYTPFKEGKLQYDSREILYMVGKAVIESSCCGTGCWSYVMVPGYVIKWQEQTNDIGLPVTKVEPILDKSTKENIRQIISELECVSQVDFW